jgi:hypothetical protein
MSHDQHKQVAGRDVIQATVPHSAAAGQVTVDRMMPGQRRRVLAVVTDVRFPEGSGRLFSGPTGGSRPETMASPTSDERTSRL